MKHSKERIAFIASKKWCYVYNSDDFYFSAISCVRRSLFLFTKNKESQGFKQKCYDNKKRNTSPREYWTYNSIDNVAHK